MKVAFQGSYSDLRFVKSRSVAQVVIELPIEEATAFVAAFGAPVPGSECPVAIARLVPEKDAGDSYDHLSPEAMRRRRIMWGGSSEELFDYETGVRREPAPLPANDPPKERKPFGEWPLPQQAGYLCTLPAFREFLRDRFIIQDDLSTAGLAADFVRQWCGVRHRSDITLADNSGNRWLLLLSGYETWREEAAHV